MVNNAQGLEKFIVRFPDGMRNAIGIAARKNRRSMNAEIVARLAQSFDMATPIDLGEVPTSPTAMKALTLAEKNEARIKEIEDALRVVCDEEHTKDLPDDVRSIFVKLGEMLYSR
jgi:Arc-like DNA binding domain